MRVVAGSARGRSLKAPLGTDTRPTSDRVREAIFNALWSLDEIEDAVAVDLFAGSGALGIEALSRGASHVTFVEKSRAALAVIDDNLQICRLADRATVAPTDAMTYRFSEASPPTLVFADPPYAFIDWPTLLERLPEDVLLVAETGRALEVPEAWEIVRQQRYGSTWVTFTRLGPTAPAAG